MWEQLFPVSPETKSLKVAQPCPTLCHPMDYIYSPLNSPGQNTGLGNPSRIFPTQGLNPGLPHYRWILYQLSHQGSPVSPEIKPKSASKGHKMKIFLEKNMKIKRPHKKAACLDPSLPHTMEATKPFSLIIACKIWRHNPVHMNWN